MFKTHNLRRYVFYISSESVQASFWVLVSSSLQIHELEDAVDILKLQVKALKDTAERLEKKNQELKMKGEFQRKRELDYYRTLGEQLEVRLLIINK